MQFDSMSMHGSVLTLDISLARRCSSQRTRVASTFNPCTSSPASLPPCRFQSGSPAQHTWSARMVADVFPIGLGAGRSLLARRRSLSAGLCGGGAGWLTSCPGAHPALGGRLSHPRCPWCGGIPTVVGGRSGRSGASPA
jgi:hypothetical protein